MDKINHSRKKPGCCVKSSLFTHAASSLLALTSIANITGLLREVALRAARCCAGSLRNSLDALLALGELMEVLCA